MNKYAYILLLASMLTACSSEDTFVPEEDISGGTDPMLFAVAGESQTGTRAAANALRSGFMVSCYKSYGQPQQHVVMPQYEVRYHTSGTAWDGTIREHWTYDDVSGQYLRYWDYSAFPYRFHCLAPYPASTAGFTLDDTHLSIPTRYYAQTCLNGMLTPNDATAEPYIVAQVQRHTDGTDQDLLTTDPEKTVLNNATTTLGRDVWIPFHHLNSKTRFGIYHTTAWLTANKTYIQDLTISVISPHFATCATGYEATCAATTPPSSPDSWYRGTANSGFTGVTTIDPTIFAPHEIFHFDGGADIADNDLTEKQTRKTAYFLQCPGGIMQIPQEDVQMIVSFDLYRADGTLYKRFSNVPVRLELDDHTYQYSFDWQSGYINTYYLVIGEIDDKLEISFTCTLTPWEDVNGTLSTDLEQ